MHTILISQTGKERRGARKGRCLQVRFALPCKVMDKYRITVLTERLIRMEYSEDGLFNDEKTLSVFNRDFPVTAYIERDRDGLLEIETEALVLRYDRKPFTSQGLNITLKANGAVWNYGKLYAGGDNLFGTARTLDFTDGLVMLDDGIFSMSGYAVLDDSTTPLLVNGEVAERKNECRDIYFFGFGDDFYGGLKEFYTLTGEVPMLPRYALGNWWSKFERYSEQSYLEMLKRFEEENVPLSVAVLDMDWHLTDVDPKYGNGWTGFTWNKELFPDYGRFLKTLHEKGLAVTLNLHPADGIRAFEAMYPEAAKRVGIDPASQETISFDLTDKAFRDAYFKDTLIPYEKKGVDFWWIDWQQGTKMADSDIDPLWLLNHYHFEDQKKRGKRAMIFSRYAGIGSHRYPVGFSGDTVSSWKSLHLQPFFTSTSSNAGYGWWSHDIGGHMQGDKDLERLVRWIQFGVFSPIMRLHSSNSPFFIKEPSRLEQPYRGIIDRFMRLRHRMIPYLYTMNHRSYAESEPLIRPVYYEYPKDEKAYSVGEEYFFGSELLVGAICEKEDSVLKMSSVRCFIPEGRYYDIFTGRIYERSKLRKLYRSIETIPVLIKSGGIVPLAGENDLDAFKNPEELEILIGAGASGSFTIYEDDGITEGYRDGKSVRTDISVDWDEAGKKMTVRISGAQGELSLIPTKRSFMLKIYGINSVDGYETDKKTHTVKISLDKCNANDVQEIVIENVVLASNDWKKEVFDVIEYAWCELRYKEEVNHILNTCGDIEKFDGKLSQLDIPEIIKDAIREVY